MELITGLVILGGLVAWGVAGWWRYWRAVQVLALRDRWVGAQIETLLRQLRRQAERPAVEQDARARRERQAEEWLSEIEKGWTE